MTKNVELQLTNDYIFKRLFSKKGNEDILKDLLEGILEIPIKEVEVMQEVELERLDIKDKLGVLDIKAVINEDITVDIEMQIADEKNMIERTLYYWAGLYYTGLKRGQDYKLNNKVITINILMYNIFKKEKGCSLSKYLTQTRLEQAKKYLTEYPDKTLIEIAESIGYSDVYYFSKNFKKYYGISPSKYQEERKM